MGHQQWAKSAWQFAQRAPWNFHRIDQELMDFDRHYVMWKYEPSHQVDQKTAEAFAAFMRAETKPEILCAAKKLHIVKDDGSVSLAMLEEIVQELVLVSRPRTKRVQQEDCWGLPYVCSCSTFACRGQCEHDLFVQWIEGTGAVEFHSLQDFTRTDKVIKCMPQPAGRPCDAPGAWETIQAVQQKRDKARAKAAQKKRKARAAQSAAEDAIWTPRKAAKTEEADKTVAGMLAGLTHAAFMRHYEALIKVGKAKMPLGEALASGVAKAVHALHGDARTGPNVHEVVCECWKLLLLACTGSVGSRLITRSRRFDWDFFFCSGLGAHQLNKARVELDCFLPGPLLRQRCLPGNSWMDGSGKRMKRKLPAVLHRPARSDAALAKSRRSPFLAWHNASSRASSVCKKNVDLALACRLIRSCIGVARKATSTVCNGPQNVLELERTSSCYHLAQCQQQSLRCLQ